MGPKIFVSCYWFLVRQHIKIQLTGNRQRVTSNQLVLGLQYYIFVGNFARSITKRNPEPILSVFFEMLHQNINRLIHIMSESQYSGTITGHNYNSFFKNIRIFKQPDNIFCQTGSAIIH